MLVPYEHLDEKEKVCYKSRLLPSVTHRNARLIVPLPVSLTQDMSRRNAVELVKAMIYFGYKFKLGVGRTAVDPSELSSGISDDKASSLKLK